MIEFPQKPGFKEISHPADIAVVVTAESLKSIFIEAMDAMREICGIKLLDKTLRYEKISITGNTNELLLVTFLNEVVYICEKGYWPTETEIEINGTLLEFAFYKTKCIVTGHEIKAVTFSEMAIVKNRDYWQTKIVFDV